MVSDYVMTEKNCNGSIIAPDSVGMGAYTMDSHHTQRYVKDGQVKNEGDVQVGVPRPYPISYRSLVPKADECTNLLVPWCLSASHIAYGSIRMEPVFMTLGQSAATAACFAIDEEVSVQEVPYPKLKAQMLADGQSLTTGVTDASGIVVDNADSTGVTITGDLGCEWFHLGLFRHQLPPQPRRRQWNQKRSLHSRSPHDGSSTTSISGGRRTAIDPTRFRSM